MRTGGEPPVDPTPARRSTPRPGWPRQTRQVRHVLQHHAGPTPDRGRQVLFRRRHRRCRRDLPQSRSCCDPPRRPQDAQVPRRARLPHTRRRLRGVDRRVPHQAGDSSGGGARPSGARRARAPPAPARDAGLVLGRPTADHAESAGRVTGSVNGTQHAKPLSETSKDGVAERVYRRDDGSAWAEYSVRYKNEYGKRARAVFRVRQDALDFKAAVAYARRHGVALPQPPSEARVGAMPTPPSPLGDEELSLAELVTSLYWPQYALEELDAGTLRDYENAWRVHIAPSLGHVPVGAIGPKAIRTWQTARRRAGVGPGALAKARTMLGSVYSFAFEGELVTAHPLRQSHRRRSKKSKALTARRKAIRLPGPTAIETVRASMLAKDRIVGATLVTLIAYAGLRPGEALALKWSNVLRQTLLIEDASDDGQAKELKNQIAYRSVTLVEPLREDLERLRRHLGVRARDASPVLPNAANEHWTDEQYKRW